MINILDVKDLNFSLEDRTIVSKVSLSLRKHQVLALLGQSGSGKSTLLKLIAGLLEPDSGILNLEGERITPPSEKLIPGNAKIKIVRQDNPLFPNVTLRENIAYELRFYNKEYQKERVDKLLRLTGISKVADQLPRHSSEGEQQRTAIARALADEPSVLLLDEPFSNLDHKNKSRLKKEVVEIVKQEEMACVFVTHDISDVYGTAEQLAILKNGKITQIDSPLRIYAQPKSVYEASLTGDYNLIKNSEALEVLGIKTKAKNVLIRPEAVQISSNGKFRGKALSFIDMGTFKEVLLQVQNVKLTAFTMKQVNIEEEVNFDILKFWGL